MGPLGVQETVFIAVFALLVFGPKKLPELGRTIGKAMTEFRRASSELKASFDREMSVIDRENESLKEVTRNYVSDVIPANSYHDNYYDSGAYLSDGVETSTDNPSTVSASAPQGADSTVSANAAEDKNPAKIGSSDPAAESKTVHS